MLARKSTVSRMILNPSSHPGPLCTTSLESARLVPTGLMSWLCSWIQPLVINFLFALVSILIKCLASRTLSQLQATSGAQQMVQTVLWRECQHKTATLWPVSLSLDQKPHRHYSNPWDEWCLSWAKGGTDKAKHRAFPFCLRLLSRPDTDPATCYSLSHDQCAKIKTICPLKLSNHWEKHFLFTQLTGISPAWKTTLIISHPICNLFSLWKSKPAEALWSLHPWVLSLMPGKLISLLVWFLCLM